MFATCNEDNFFTGHRQSPTEVPADGARAYDGDAQFISPIA